MLSTSHQPSLKDRVFRSTCTSTSFNPLSSSSRSKEYKSWDEDQLHRACEAVQRDRATAQKEGKKQRMSVRRAADAYHVPKSTLQDRLSGRVIFGAKSRPQKYLCDLEEEELVSFLIGSASIGFVRTRTQVLTIVQNVVTKKAVNAVVCHGWWESFKRRHSNITIRTAEHLSYCRAVASSPKVLDSYYDVLEQALVDNGLQDSPSQIFNMDETGMPLEPDLPRVVAGKGQKHVSCITTGNKAQITVVAACNSAGYAIPPMVIFDRKTLKPEMTVGEVPGTMYGLSSSRWMDGDLFHLWFTHHFLAHAPPARPLMLLLDGHSSHYHPETIRCAAEEQVILFCLPPHTTHLTQPLDKGCFGPLKAYWKEECHHYMANNRGMVVTRFTFSQVFSRAWCRGMNMQNVIGGFKTTGIYPFNRHALRPREQQHGQFRPAALSEKTGLKFTPLYTPTRSRQLRSVPDSTHLHQLSHLHGDEKSPPADSCQLSNLHGCDFSPSKYLLKVTIPRLSGQEKQEVLAKIRAFNYSGFDGRVFGNVIRHHQSFVGRDYKAWAQMALFIIGNYLSDDQRRVLLSLSKVRI